jgi:hypothetical protein
LPLSQLCSRFIDSVKRMQALALLVLIAVALILLAAALLNG